MIGWGCRSHFWACWNKEALWGMLELHQDQLTGNATAAGVWELTTGQGWFFRVANASTEQGHRPNYSSATAEEALQRSVWQAFLIKDEIFKHKNSELQKINTIGNLWPWDFLCCCGKCSDASHRWRWLGYLPDLWWRRTGFYFRSKAGLHLLVYKALPLGGRHREHPSIVRA